MNNKKVFKAKDSSGNEVELAILRPSPKQQVEAQLIYNKAWREAEAAGNILRRDIDEISTKRGLWNEEKIKEVESIERQILDLERKLRGGANSFKSLDEAKAAALEIRKLRNQRTVLVRPRLDLDSVTCENFADIARINYIISQTTVYNADGRKYFSSMDDFVNHSNSELALSAAVSYYELNAGDREDTYEDAFLKKYKFANSDGHLIDSEGNLVTIDGRRVDSDGRYLNEKNEFVDVNNVPVDEKGNYIIPYKEFDLGV